jgi:hypothetical protein
VVALSARRSCRGSAGSVCPKGTDTDGDRVRSIFAIANPDKLDALARPN